MSKPMIRIERTVGDDGAEDIGLIMSMSDFESSGPSLRSDLQEFKELYLSTIKRAKEVDNDSAAGRRKVSSRKRWESCRILSELNRNASNKFEISNYKQAYSRDFGVPMRSVRTYLDFGRHFERDEVTDRVPYSVYAELVFRVNGLRARGLFDSEKKRLNEMGAAGSLPNRDAYRRQLDDLLGSSSVDGE